MLPDLLTEPEVARLLKLSPRSLRNARAAGELSCVRFGRSIRYRVADVDDFISCSVIANEATGPTKLPLRGRQTGKGNASPAGFMARRECRSR